MDNGSFYGEIDQICKDDILIGNSWKLYNLLDGDSILNEMIKIKDNKPNENQNNNIINEPNRNIEENADNNQNNIEREDNVDDRNEDDNDDVEEEEEREDL